MTCKFCRHKIHKTDEGFWSDGQTMPTFCGHSPRGVGKRYHEPEPPAPPMISWYEIDAASKSSEQDKLYVWTRVVARLRSAERSCLMLFLMIVVLMVLDIVTLLWR